MNARSLAVPLAAIIVVAVMGYWITQMAGPTVEGSSSATQTSSSTTTLTTSSSAGTTQTLSTTLSTTTAQFTTQSTCTETLTIGAGGAVIGASEPTPCGCALVDSNSRGSLYVSPNPKVGDSVCIQASDKDSMQVGITVENSTGSVVFSEACAATGGIGPGGSGGDTCGVFWNTALPDPHGNPIEPGTYLIATSDSLKANVTLSAAA